MSIVLLSFNNKKGYAVDKAILSKSTLLETLYEHTNGNININFPKDLDVTTEDTDAIIKILKEEKIDQVTLNNILGDDVDKYGKMLKMLAVIQYNIDYIKDVMITIIKNKLESEDNTNIVEKIMKLPAFNNIIDMSNISIKNLVKNYNENMKDLFMKVLNTKCKEKDEMIEVTGLEINDLFFDNESIVDCYDYISYGLIDKKFIDNLNKIPNVYLAGGSLISCINGYNYKEWSDIDFWIVKDKNFKENMKELLKLIIGGLCKITQSHPFASTNNNVITIYCPKYKRNIQIIITNVSPEENIMNFDFDCVKAYYMNNRVYASVHCIRANLENKIYSVGGANEFRIIKMLLKEYKFDDSIKTHSHIIKQFTDKTYSNDLLNKIGKVTNKYYYPEVCDVDQYIHAKTPVEKASTAIVYNILTRFNHKIILEDIHKMLIYIDDSTENTFKCGNKYDNQYDQYIKKIININDFKVEKLGIKNIKQTKFGYFANITYENSKSLFVTDPIRLFNNPLTEKNKYCTEVDESFYRFRLYNDFQDENMNKLFCMIDQIDEHYIKNINTILSEINKENKCVNYYRKVKNQCDKNDIFSRFVALKMSTRRENDAYVMDTKIYKDGKLLNEKHTDLHKFIKPNTNVKLYISTDRLTCLPKSINKKKYIDCSLRLTITRIDIL